MHNMFNKIEKLHLYQQVTWKQWTNGVEKFDSSQCQIFPMKTSPNAPFSTFITELFISVALNKSSYVYVATNFIVMKENTISSKQNWQQKHLYQALDSTAQHQKVGMLNNCK